MRRAEACRIFFDNKSSNCQFHSVGEVPEGPSPILISLLGCVVVGYGGLLGIRAVGLRYCRPLFFCSLVVNVFYIRIFRNLHRHMS